MENKTSLFFVTATFEAMAKYIFLGCLRAVIHWWTVASFWLIIGTLHSSGFPLDTWNSSSDVLVCLHSSF